MQQLDGAPASKRARCWPSGAPAGRSVRHKNPHAWRKVPDTAQSAPEDRTEDVLWCDPTVAKCKRRHSRVHAGGVCGDIAHKSSKIMDNWSALCLMRTLGLAEPSQACLPSFRQWV